MPALRSAQWLCDPVTDGLWESVCRHVAEHCGDHSPPNLGEVRHLREADDAIAGTFEQRVALGVCAFAPAVAGIINLDDCDDLKCLGANDKIAHFAVEGGPGRPVACCEQGGERDQAKGTNPSRCSAATACCAIRSSHWL